MLPLLAYLTLTRVVFEYMAQQICVNFGQNLTLTRVVFEFEDIRAGAK